MSRELKLDANETKFLKRELESIKSKSYDKKYSELKNRALIPVSFEAGEHSESIVYRQYDMFGAAKIVESYAKDFPRVDVVVKEFSQIIKPLGDSYGYSIQEIRASRALGKSLEQRKANAAKRAMMQTENQLALFGKADIGFKGFFNHPNVPLVTKVNAGAWSTLTPAQVIADMNKLANAPINTTKGIEVPDTLLLPVDVYTYVSSTPRSETTDTTILEFFMKANPHITNVEWVNELKEAGASNVTRAMVYKRDPDAVTLEIPMDFLQHEPDREGLEYVIYCEERFGGVIFYYPLSAAYMDGI